MTFQLTEPILLIGLGGVGASLAEKAKKSLNSDCLLISHDQKDLTAENLGRTILACCHYAFLYTPPSEFRFQ